MTTTLFRPVGLHELALVWDSGMREFPPRLPHQPIFYPVVSMEYALQIACDWNTRDENSGFAGFVTRFDVSQPYLTKFEPHIVGSSSHVEYWIPAEELATFNASIEGLIRVEAAFFGVGFKGRAPDSFGLKGKDVVMQFVTLVKTWDCSRMDFVREVSTNRKTMFLNFLFWVQHDFEALGVNQHLKEAAIEHLKEAWQRNHIEIPLPGV